MRGRGFVVSGVYAIRDHLGREYIGSSVDVQRRWRQHRADLESGEHHSYKLQRAWHKYGPDSFKFVFLKYEADPIKVRDLEQRLMDERNPHYNIARSVERPGTYWDIDSEERERRKVRKLEIEASAARDCERMFEMLMYSARCRPQDRSIKAVLVKCDQFREEAQCYEFGFTWFRGHAWFDEVYERVLNCYQGIRLERDADRILSALERVA